MMVPTVDNIPVLLPPHSHPEFGDPAEHYHIDYRYHPGEPLQAQVVFSDSPIVYKSLPLLREVYQIEISGSDLPFWLASEYPKLCGNRCPHRGLPLTDLGNGFKQCVGHGLTFNKNNESVKRFNMRCGKVKVPAVFKQKLYKFEMVDEDEIYEMDMETECGVRVCRVKFKTPIKVNRGDVLKITVHSK